MRNYQIPISVIMPAYNCEEYVKEAIESILNQTFKHFELIVIDDGSTDNTGRIVKSIEDSRIVYIKNRHRGIVDALNTGLNIARGKYMARMDADDISYLDRLQKQYDFMEGNLDIAVCGTHIVFQNNNIGNCGYEYWSDPLHYLAQGNILYHGTVMMRSQFIIIKKLQYRHKSHAEDYYMWFEVVKNGGRLYTIPETLYFYRENKEQVTSKFYYKMWNTTEIIKDEIQNYIFVNNKLSVIIPFLNEGENVIKTIENIQKTTEEAVNIILINDGSNDGFDYKEHLKLFDNGRLDYYESKERMGVADCRNAGVNLCKTPYFLFLDAHMAFLNNNWAAELIKELQTHSDDLLSLQTLGLETNFRMKNLRNKVCGCKWHSFNEKNNWDIFSCKWDAPIVLNDINEVDVVMGAAYATSTESWKKLHGLEGLIKYGGDEQFMSLKYKCSGHKVYTINYIQVGHIYREVQPYVFSTYDRTYNQIIIIMTLFEGEQEKELLKNCKQLNDNFDKCYDAIDKEWIKQEKEYLKTVFAPDYQKTLTSMYDIISASAND
jgi:glycosyltransferase involved in cell wall biosynthesis